MNTQVVERLTLENGLRFALERKELFLVYQPQMDMATERISGLEALLRWQHPDLGLVPPDKFIRIAENCGLIMPIGERGAKDCLCSGTEVAGRWASSSGGSRKCVGGTVSSRGLLRTR